jgi:hypothetical protein
MKKLIITVLAIITLATAAFADVTTATDTLEIKTTIAAVSTIEFLSGSEGVETVTFGASDTSKTVTASLWTNKIDGDFPSVKLEAKPLAHDSASGAYIKYTVNGTAVENSDVVISTDLFSGTVLNSTSAATYTKDVVIGIPAENRTDALAGDYTGSIVVTVTAN